MGKIFTITEGLENMGALRTGGQGSVYKGRRIGEIYVAVKLLPTPIQAETDDDKNFKDFMNEVEKLKKVNEHPNPNVVKILNSGITESGSLPFIEMEFIEGPDLGDLLAEPNAPVFKIPDAIKVAYQLANALAHCHKEGVKHGDVKSNNVKFNINTGNYMLIDFGLAIMSNEQRRDSLRHAGAVEFMAPEQNDGLMLPQSDVYSYGVILYELLAGVVPFPLADNGQSARNNVMVSHLETPVPDLLEQRQQRLPAAWPGEDQKREMQVPDWLLSLVYKCLQKKPEDRFADGTAIREFILLQSTALSSKSNTEGALMLQNENKRLQEQLTHARQEAAKYKDELHALETELANKSKETVVAVASAIPPIASTNTEERSKAAVFLIPLLFLALGATAGYFIFHNKTGGPLPVASDTAAVSKTIDTQNIGNTITKQDTQVKQAQPEDTVDTPETVKKPVVKEQVITKPIKKDTGRKKPKPVKPKPQSVKPIAGVDVGKTFAVFNSQASFYENADVSTMQNTGISRGSNVRLKALIDRNGFIFVRYTGENGQTKTGWLNKKDLIKVGD